MALWIRQGKGVLTWPDPNDIDRYLEKIEEEGMNTVRIPDMYKMDTTKQKTDLILLEKSENVISAQIKLNKQAKIIGARILGSNRNNHRYCELEGFGGTWVFTEKQPWDRPIAIMDSITYYWEQNDGRGILGR